MLQKVFPGHSDHTKGSVMLERLHIIKQDSFCRRNDRRNGKSPNIRSVISIAERYLVCLCQSPQETVSSAKKIIHMHRNI